MPAPTKKPRKKADPDPILHCSFCNKTQHEVRKMIAGPKDLFICDECIDLCNSIIGEEALARAAQSDQSWRDHLAARARAIATDADELNGLLRRPRPDVDPRNGQPRSSEE